MFKQLWCLVLLVLLSGICFARSISENTRVRNLTAFTRLWGYVRHWYPSDEAQNFDWDRFAIYGAKEVSTARNDRELKVKLYDLFRPLVPQLQLYSNNVPEPVPSDPVPGRVKAFWQYSGYENTGNPSVYMSIRTNRPIKIRNYEDYDLAWTTLMPKLAPITGNEPKLRITFRVRKLAADSLTTYLYAGFAGNVVEDSLSSEGWNVKSYELVSQGDNQEPLWFGMSYFNCLQLDDIKIEQWAEDTWQSLFETGFEDESPSCLPRGFNLNYLPNRGVRGHRVDIAVEDSPEGKLLSIHKSPPDQEFTLGLIDRIFEEEIPWGELLDKPLVRGLNCSFPLVLQCDDKRTYPICDPTALSDLSTKMTNIDIDDRGNRFVWLAGIIKYWNELQFFFPLFEYDYLDWEAELPKTLKACIRATDWQDYKLVLRRLMCKTEDGHAFLTDRSNNGDRPPFNAILLDGKWIVSKDVSDPPAVPPGSEVLKMNGKPFARLMREALPYYYSSNRETTALRLFQSQLSPYPDSVATFTFRTPDRRRLELSLPFARYEGWEWTVPNQRVVDHRNGILYLNLCLLSDDELAAAMPQILAAKGLILDLRYYPSVSYDIISQLLTKPDSLANTYIKRYIRPNEELTRLYEDTPTWGLQPAEPHISAKVIALCSRQSQSYCESFLAALQHNKLATLVGQPTAGANGNVVMTRLPGRINAYWTGMLVRNPDGSRFFTNGVQPDILIQRVLADYVEGKDPELNKALEILNANL
ncbi:MAG: hypothetical protein CVU49_00665 [Candidatus Cloacimonetes bacterium HGW-Cloacimonetes-2]|jgi:hypothetical protein|nr:MAG: hypothetical protein CVU49_00665 [Candidatus Cloacimonetes bacterium HGW-Cloacimonetes-2]